MKVGDKVVCIQKLDVSDNIVEFFEIGDEYEIISIYDNTVLIGNDEFEDYFFVEGKILYIWDFFSDKKQIRNKKLKTIL